MLLFWVLVFSGSLYAADSGDGCLRPSSPNEFLQCVIKNHPDIQVAQIELNQANHLESRAGQIPNPEFAGNGSYGRSLGDLLVYYQLGILQPFELGGKRGARLFQADAQKDRAFASFLSTSEETIITTVLSLHRLRHIRRERELLEQTLEILDHLEAQLKSRPRLSPEQEVSLMAFRLAGRDASTERSNLNVEESHIKALLELAIGHSVELTEQILPQYKMEWPALESRPALASGSKLKLAQADFKLAQAELDLAKSASWTDLKLGPFVQIQSQGGINYNSFGFGFSLSLPVFHTNGGGRRYAHLGVDAAEVTLHVQESRIQIERNFKVEQYRSAIKILTKVDVHEDVQKRYKNIQNLYQRGLIPSSLLLETRRQIYTSRINRDDQELRAVDAYWRIQALDGKIMEQKL